MNTSASDFSAGDSVQVAEGPNVGTSGVFLHLNKDEHWASIEEQGHQGISLRTQSHPVIWLQHAAGTTV